MGGQRGAGVRAGGTGGWGVAWGWEGCLVCAQKGQLVCGVPGGGGGAEGAGCPCWRERHGSGVGCPGRRGGCGAVGSLSQLPWVGSGTGAEGLWGTQQAVAPCYPRGRTGRGLTPALGTTRPLHPPLQQPKAAPWPRAWGSGVSPHSPWGVRAGRAGLSACCQGCRFLLCSCPAAACLPAALLLQTCCPAPCSCSAPFPLPTWELLGWLCAGVLLGTGDRSLPGPWPTRGHTPTGAAAGADEARHQSGAGPACTYPRSERGAAAASSPCRHPPLAPGLAPPAQLTA